MAALPSKYSVPFIDLIHYLGDKDIRTVTIGFSPNEGVVNLIFRGGPIPKKLDFEKFKKTVLNFLEFSFTSELKHFSVIGFKIEGDPFLNHLARVLKQCVNLVELNVEKCHHTFSESTSPFIELLDTLPNLQTVSFRNNVSWLDITNIERIITIIEKKSDSKLQLIDIMDDAYIDYIVDRDDFTRTHTIDEYDKERFDMLNEKIPRIRAQLNIIRRNQMRRLGQGHKHHHDHDSEASDKEIEDALVFYRSIQEITRNGGKIKIVK